MRILNFRVSILAVLLLFFMLFPVVAEGGIKVKDENTNISIYNPSGRRIDSKTEIEESGYVIKTKDESAMFTSPFGSFALDADSILVIENYDENRPSLYLINGTISLTVTGKGTLTLYTPTETFRMNAGTYSLEYTEYRTRFTNLSDRIVSVKDSLRGKSYTVIGMHTLDLFTNEMKPILNTSSTRALTGTIATSALIFDYTIGEGKAIIGHGYALTEKEINDFLAFAAEYDMRISSFKKSIYPGKIIFYYPARYSNNTALEILKNAIESYDIYIGRFNTPSAVDLVTTSATDTYFENTLDLGSFDLTYRATKDDIKIILPLKHTESIKTLLLDTDNTLNITTVQDGLYIPRKATARSNYYYIDELISSLSSYLYSIGANVISGFKVVGNSTVNYAATMGMATISYPDFISDDRAGAFFDWLATNNPMIASYFVYFKDGLPGRIELSYPITMTKEEIEQAADYIASEANKYIGKYNVPAAPQVDKGRLIKVPGAPKLGLTMQPSK